MLEGRGGKIKETHDINQSKGNDTFDWKLGINKVQVKKIRDEVKQNV